MEWLNYHHLLYFWTVAREGSVARAGAELRLTPPTISSQIHALEQVIGEKLFERAGRTLVLTEAGQLVFGYADQIFSLGRELMQTLKGRSTGHSRRLVVGVAGLLPKLTAYRLLEPVLEDPEPILLVCREDKPERLLAELSLRGLDVVLSDTPLRPEVKVRAYNHLLGDCPVAAYGTATHAAAYRPDFPRSLNGAPFLLPPENTSLRRDLERWFEANDIRPEVRAEFDDASLLNVFAQAGAGIFVGPTVLEADFQRSYGLQRIGRLDSVQESFYLISIERRIKHPVVAKLVEAAREKLFC